MSGHEIKVAGDNPEAGVYFASSADPSQRVKAAERLAENAASKLIGIIPTLSAGMYTLEAVTQYSSGNFFLKEPRVIAFGPTLTALRASPYRGLCPSHIAFV
ncbi:MAG: DUF4469 domain-containing protein [Treponema sp.]|nr:DUF4469 domain-containing protein [Treponema sp.]